jgi:competence protein ComEC
VQRLAVVIPAARLVGPGCLGLVTVAMAAMAVTGVRLALVRAAVLPGLEGAVVTVLGTVGGEPRQTRYGGRLVGLTVSHVQHGRGAWRTRERATVILPAGAAPVSLGDRLTVVGTVRPAMHTDPLGWRPAVDLRQPTVLARSPSRSLPLRITEIVRSRARDQALASLPPERAGLLAGMALGDTSILRGDVEAAFKAAGLTHLMAVSGANLALVLGVALGLALLLGAGRPALGVVGMLVVPGFVLLTRWEPSVLRAAVMAVLALLGVATGRGPGGRRALCLAVTILLLADPALAFSLGFLLSVTATAGILWLSPPLLRVLPARLPEAVRVAGASTLAAQAATLPVAALATGTLPLAALPANLLAIPLAAAPMLLGVLNAVFAIPAAWAADLACLAAAPFLGALIQVAHRARALGEPVVLPAGPARLLLLVIPAAFAMACHRAADKRAADKRTAAAQRRARSP